MKTLTALATIVVLLFVVSSGWTQTSDDKAKEHADLEKALKDAKIPLERGLTASAKEGEADFGEIRGGGRQAAAVRVHDEGQ